MKQVTISGNPVSVWASNGKFVDVDFSNRIETPISIFSIVESRQDKNEDDFLIEIESLLTSENYMFSDNYSDEPSDDHFVTLSANGYIDLLPQTKESVENAVLLFKASKIIDIARIRIEDCLA